MRSVEGEGGVIAWAVHAKEECVRGGGSGLFRDGGELVRQAMGGWGSRHGIEAAMDEAWWSIDALGLLGIGGRRGAHGLWGLTQRAAQGCAWRSQLLPWVWRS